MEEYRAIAGRIVSDRPMRVLDWGCGYGQLTDLLSRAGLGVAAFDYRPGVEEGLQRVERYPHLHAYLSPDPRRLPFGDGSFDAVLSCGVLEHVEDPDASLEELRRVLVPGGTLYVYKLPNRLSYLEAIARHAGLYYHGANEHDRVYDERLALELLSRHGFEVSEIRRMNMLPLTLTARLAARAAHAIWLVNRGLSTIPGINRFATNLELIARSPSRSTGEEPRGASRRREPARTLQPLFIRGSSQRPPAASSAATAGEHWP
jgi:2-polyprenyl-3-methyl-5-hydroxy-6-metoxy-1,4-benzoquinol methylase